jgi:hypothetical protein
VQEEYDNRDFPIEAKPLSSEAPKKNCQSRSIDSISSKPSLYNIKSIESSILFWQLYITCTLRAYSLRLLSPQLPGLSIEGTSISLTPATCKQVQL